MNAIELPRQEIRPVQLALTLAEDDLSPLTRCKVGQVAVDNPYANQRSWPDTHASRATII
jgi:hypothetical protein